MSQIAKNKNDARYIATHKLLQKTFLKLLEEEGFQKITVRKIVSEANLNRGTFYIHAQDKYDLLEQIEDDIHQNMMSGVEKVLENFEIRSPLMIHDVLLQSAEYVKAHGDLIMLLMRDDCDPLFFEKYAGKIKLKMLSNTKNMNNEKEYIFALIGGIISGLFGEWVRREMKESPEEYIDIIMKIVSKINLTAILGTIF